MIRSTETDWKEVEREQAFEFLQGTSKSDMQDMENQHLRKVSLDELQNRQTDLYFNTKQFALRNSKLKQVH